MKRHLKSTPVARPLEAPDHTPWLIGTFAASLLVALWCYPSGAHPFENLLFCVLIAGVGLILFLESVRRGRTEILDALNDPVIWTSILLAVFAALRHRWSPVPALGREWVANLAWLPVALLAGLSIARFPSPSKPAAPLTAFRRTLVIAAIAFGLYALYQRIVAYPRSAAELEATIQGPVSDLMTQSLLHALREGRVAGRLGNPNLFGAQLALLAVFCAATVFKDLHREWRWIGVVGLLATIVGVSLSRSRGGLLTLLVALLAAFLISRQTRRSSKMSVAALGATIYAFLVPQASAAAGWIERIGRIDTIRERLFYWDIAWKIWLRNPLFGEGPGSFEMYYPILKSPLARESQYAHSWLFQSAAELGIVGLLVFCALWLLLGRRLLNSLSQKISGQLSANEAAWPLLAALILAFNGLFEFSLQWREFLIMLGFLIGLGCGYLSTTQSRGLRQSNNTWPAWTVFAGIALCAALAVSISLPLARANDANWRGDLAMQSRDYREAVSAYLQAVDHEPDNSQYRIALSGALMMSGDKQQAWSQLEQAQVLNSHSASARAAKASWMEREGRLKESLAAMDEAIERYPTRVAYRLDRARLRIALNLPDDARADLQFIENEHLPVWEFELESYNTLRQKTGLVPVNF